VATAYEALFKSCGRDFDYLLLKTEFFFFFNRPKDIFKKLYIRPFKYFAASDLSMLSPDLSSDLRSSASLERCNCSTKCNQIGSLAGAKDLFFLYGSSHFYKKKKWSLYTPWEALWGRGGTAPTLS
jgi:hypothetical protein